METTFSELRQKNVINVLTGRILGNVIDIAFDLRLNCLLGIIVPGSKSFFNIFSCSKQIFVPMSNICKIGEDVILVEVIENCKKKKKPVRVFDMGEDKANVENNSNTINTEDAKHIK